jgi:hypothetical protein
VQQKLAYVMNSEAVENSCAVDIASLVGRRNSRVSRHGEIGLQEQKSNE